VTTLHCFRFSVSSTAKCVLLSSRGTIRTRVNMYPAP
jgi:hypothetical protein